MSTAILSLHMLLASTAANFEGPSEKAPAGFLLDAATNFVVDASSRQAPTSAPPLRRLNQTAPTLSQDTFSITLAQGEIEAVEIMLGNTNDLELGWSLEASQPFLLFSNGAVFNTPAPGPSLTGLSVLEDISLGMNLFGFGARQNLDIRLADQFYTHQSVEITEFHLYGYKFESGLESPFDAAIFQIWDEMPSDTGAPIFGDNSTNTLFATSWFSGWRVPESELTNEQRPIMELRVSPAVHGSLQLNEGMHWIDFSYFSEETGPLFSPPIATNGSTTTGDALQFSIDDGGWNPLVDFEGTNTPQGLPFRVIGLLRKPPGSKTCEDPSAISWLETSATHGSIEGQGNDSSTLTLSTATLAPGLYQATLCLYSNSPIDAVQPIDISLEVRSSQVFSDRFEQ